MTHAAADTPAPVPGTTPEPGGRPGASPALAMRGVRFRYPSTGFGLAVEAFDLPADARAFLRGPSGSGKTTFLSLAAGLLAPSEGEIVVAGTPMPSRPPGRDALRAEAIGIVHQQFNLLPASDVLTNVVLPLAFSRARRGRAGGARRRAATMLDRLGVPAALHRAPARALSVGQQQRVAIARALIGGPALVIADEPTSALDADARDAFLDLLMEAVDEAGAALLMVSHDPVVGHRFPVRLDLRDVARAGVDVGAGIA